MLFEFFVGAWLAVGLRFVIMGFVDFDEKEMFLCFCVCWK